MNKLFLSLLLAVMVTSASSQRVYFVYLQTEQGQPFFVRLNDQVYSSSAGGYIILSKLRDSSYNLSVGFPQASVPEQRFAITVRGKDQGFLLKNFEGKGWGLFDLQTLSVQMAAGEQPRPSNESASGAKEVSAFTSMLAKAANDSTLKEQPIVAKQEIKSEEKPKVEETKVVAEEKTEIKAEQVKTDPPKVETPKTEPPKPVIPVEVVSADPSKSEIKSEIPKTEIAKTEPVKTEEVPVKQEIIEPVAVKTESPKTVEEGVEYKPSVVKRRSESSTTEGFGLTFLDAYPNGSTDTIAIFIANPKPVVAAPVREERKFLEISSDSGTATMKAKLAEPEIKKEEPAITPSQPVVVVDTVSAKPTMTNGCKEVAAESDFLKLRKMMAAGESDDDMLDEARKYFRTKCFMTLQVKNLGTLFLTDAGRYKFYDLAYGYVADATNYAELQSELKEEYYINRFKAMLRAF